MGKTPGKAEKPNGARWPARYPQHEVNHASSPSTATIPAAPFPYPPDFFSSLDCMSPSLDNPSTETGEAIPLRGSQLVDQLIAEQDDVIRLLDELDARIEKTILSLTQQRTESDKSAA